MFVYYLGLLYVVPLPAMMALSFCCGWLLFESAESLKEVLRRGRTK